MHLRSRGVKWPETAVTDGTIDPTMATIVAAVRAVSCVAEQTNNNDEQNKNLHNEQNNGATFVEIGITNHNLNQNLDVNVLTSKNDFSANTTMTIPNFEKEINTILNAQTNNHLNNINKNETTKNNNTIQNSNNIENNLDGFNFSNNSEDKSSNKETVLVEIDIVRFVPSNINNMSLINLNTECTKNEPNELAPKISNIHVNFNDITTENQHQIENTKVDKIEEFNVNVIQNNSDNNLFIEKTNNITDPLQCNINNDAKNIAENQKLINEIKAPDILLNQVSNDKNSDENHKTTKNIIDISFNDSNKNDKDNSLHTVNKSTNEHAKNITKLFCNTEDNILNENFPFKYAKENINESILKVKNQFVSDSVNNLENENIDISAVPTTDTNESKTFSTICDNIKDDKINNSNQQLDNIISDLEKFDKEYKLSKINVNNNLLTNENHATQLIFENNKQFKPLEANENSDVKDILNKDNLEETLKKKNIVCITENSNLNDVTQTSNLNSEINKQFKFLEANEDSNVKDVLNKNKNDKAKDLDKTDIVWITEKGNESDEYITDKTTTIKEKNLNANNKVLINASNLTSSQSYNILKINDDNTVNATNKENSNTLFKEQLIKNLDSKFENKSEGLKVRFEIPEKEIQKLASNKQETNENEEYADLIDEYERNLRRHTCETLELVDRLCKQSEQRHEFKKSDVPSQLERSNSNIYTNSTDNYR